MDSFEPGGCDKLTKVLRFYFENKNDLSDTILCTGFKLAKCVAKAENNKGETIACMTEWSKRRYISMCVFLS